MPAACPPRSRRMHGLRRLRRALCRDPKPIRVLFRPAERDGNFHSVSILRRYSLIAYFPRSRRNTSTASSSSSTPTCRRTRRTRRWKTRSGISSERWTIFNRESTTGSSRRLSDNARVGLRLFNFGERRASALSIVKRQWMVGSPVAQPDVRRRDCTFTSASKAGVPSA